MLFIFTKNGISIKELRFCYRNTPESTFGEHMKAYGKDVGGYLQKPLEAKDPIWLVTGSAMAAMSLLLEGTDHLYAGAIGQEYQAPSGIAGRVRRDAKSLLGSIGTLRPLRALGDAWRLGTSSAILDAGDLLTGHHLAA